VLSVTRPAANASREMLTMQIGESLRAYRITRKKRLREVAAAAGISVSFLSDIETGRTLPSLETCQSLCNFYGISLSWLFSDVEIAAPNTRLQADVCHSCGSTELIEYPEDPRYLVCADCGTRR
jgi:transcriptional regulator with XRE-family HTH domain